MLLNKREMVNLGAGQENKKPEMTYDQLLNKKLQKDKAKRKAEKKASEVAAKKNLELTKKKRTDSEEAILAEERANKEKNRMHKQVRLSKMAEWNGVKPEELGATVKKNDEKSGVLIFKIQHKPTKEKSVRDQLRIVAKKACRNRNKSVDAEF